MIVYYTVLTIICLLKVVEGKKRIMLIAGSKQIPYSSICIFLTTVMLTAVSGLRYMVGTDYLQYSRNYAGYLGADTKSLFSQMGLSVVAKVSALIYNDYATWFFLMACLTIIPVCVVIYNHCDSWFYGIVFYLFLGCWHGSFNIVKQAAAASILLIGFRYIIRRDFKKWLCICIFATLFHVTALLMLPVYFLRDDEINYKKIGVIILAAVVARFSYENLFNVVSILKEGDGMVSVFSDTRNNAVNILRIIMSCVPTLLAVAFCNLKKVKDGKFITLFNLSLLNSAANIAAMNSIYLHRFCAFTTIYNVLFLPLAINRMKNRNQIIVVPALLCLYCAYWSYDLYKGSSTVVFHWIFER